MEKNVLVKKGLNGYSRESVDAYIRELDERFSDREKQYADELKRLGYDNAHLTEELKATAADAAQKAATAEDLAKQLTEAKEDMRILRDQLFVSQNKNLELEKQNIQIRAQIEHLPALRLALGQLIENIDGSVSELNETITAYVDEFKAEHLPEEEDETVEQ